MKEDKRKTTLWLYGREKLPELRYLTELESYWRRIRLLNETLSIAIREGNKAREEDIKEAKEWWHDRHAEVWKD